MLLDKDDHMSPSELAAKVGKLWIWRSHQHGRSLLLLGKTTTSPLCCLHLQLLLLLPGTDPVGKP